ncbi:unnamed protein product, partial [Callosobruchus maculatus]
MFAVLHTHWISGRTPLPLPLLLNYLIGGLRLKSAGEDREKSLCPTFAARIHPTTSHQLTSYEPCLLKVCPLTPNTTLKMTSKPRRSDRHRYRDRLL